jgi:hypothetical protein
LCLSLLYTTIINNEADTEDSNEMSRSSSVSTKDRSGKKSKPAKQRRDDSESFDVRSQYTPVFPQQGPTYYPNAQYSMPNAQYPPMGSQQYSGVVQNGYANSMPQQFATPNQQFNPAMMNNANMQGYNMTQVCSQASKSYVVLMLLQQFPPQNQPRFQPHSAPITNYGSPVQSPPLVPQQWQQQQNIYQTPYQQPRPMMGGPPGTIPYAFGQLPSTANPADPKSQHPIPGSFNRNLNPKTQSFVPGNPGLPIPQPITHHGSPHHGSPHHGSPHLTYNAYTPPQQQFNPSQQQFGNGMGYNMARQGSNNSLPSYHASPHMAHRPMMHQSMGQNMPQGLPQNMYQGQPQGMQEMPQNVQVGNHLPNYGNPNTLPPKPPTGG